MDTMLDWMLRHRGAAKLLGLVVVLVGLWSLTRTRQELYPRQKLQYVQVQVDRPGRGLAAIEAELEALERMVERVDGVVDHRSLARPSAGDVVVKVDADRDPRLVAAELTSLLSGAGRPGESAPIVHVPDSGTEAISLIVSAEVDPARLRAVVDDIARQLRGNAGVSRIERVGADEPEIRVALSRMTLVSLRTDWRTMARRIEAAIGQETLGVLKGPRAIVPVDSGSVDQEGLVALRRVGIRIPGAGEEGPAYVLPLGELADVELAPVEPGRTGRFRGRSATMLRIFAAADHNPADVAARVGEHARALNEGLPEGAGVDVWVDASKMYAERLGLVVENGLIGMLLVFGVLALTLSPRLALWVALGIPVSYLGAIAVFSALGVSLNMVSLFALLLTLGIVVDDAIIVGESIAAGQDRPGGVRAAVTRVRAPVVFSAVTTMVAFAPMYAVKGFAGEIFAVIPTVVIAVLLVSLFESMFLLPAHLHWPNSTGRQARLTELATRRISRWALAMVRRPKTTLISCGMGLLACVGLAAVGAVEFDFLKQTNGDLVRFDVELAAGCSPNQISAVRGVAEVAVAKGIGKDDLTTTPVWSAVGPAAGALAFDSASMLEQLATPRLSLELPMTVVEERGVDVDALIVSWEEELAATSCVVKARASASYGPEPPAPVRIELTHDDDDELDAARETLLQGLATFGAVLVQDPGRPRSSLRVRMSVDPRTGVDEELDLRDLVRTYLDGIVVGEHRLFGRATPVRLRLEVVPGSPEALGALPLPRADGSRMRLEDVVAFARVREPSMVRRHKGRRSVVIRADYDGGLFELASARELVRDELFADLESRFDGIGVAYVDEEASEVRAIEDLLIGFGICLVIIYGLIAIAVGGWSRSILVMLVIPFAGAGAFVGHLVLGHDFGFLSIFGIAGLSGVVVNDTLVLIHAIEQYRREGVERTQAVVQAVETRTRPILLTSLTTFAGLLPLMLESSPRTADLVPMAVSLGVGVMVGIPIVLTFVPVLYLELTGRAGGSERSNTPCPPES